MSIDKGRLFRILWAFEAGTVLPIRKGSTSSQADARIRQRVDYLIEELHLDEQDGDQP